jgi:hypothetical protein
MTQEHINTYTAEIISNPQAYRCDKSIRIHLPEFAEYIDSIEAPTDSTGSPMSFRQKLWHVINDDIEFQKGLCECGKRTKFKDFKYKQFCSTQCGTKSEKTRERMSSINSSESVLAKMRETCRQRYGTDYASQNKEVHDKQMVTLEQTLISKHGSMDAFKEHQSELLRTGDANAKIRKSLAEKRDEMSKIRSSEEWKQKYNDTIIERYGSIDEFSNHRVSKACAKYDSYGDFKKDVDAKKKKTILEKHASLEEYNAMCREKQMETIIAKYGSFEAFDAHRKETIIAKYGSLEAYDAYRKETIIAKYGSVEEYNKHIREKQMDTIISKYGSMEAYSKAIADAISSTKRKNNTFTTSSTEECVAQKLTDDGIRYIRQYKCERYPFHCDFYLEDYDLFIEIQAMWTHGKRPFNPDDLECMATLEEWQDKAKTSQFYINAIKVWTDSDVRKRETAKASSINYLEIFSNDPDEVYMAICDYICIH